MNPTPCGFCPEGVATQVDPVGKPICERCREHRLMMAVEQGGGTKISVDLVETACPSCSWRHPVPVTTIDGVAERANATCEMCKTLEEAKAFEAAARRLRERAAGILSRRRRQLRRQRARVAS